MTNGSFVTVWSLIEAGMAGLNANVIAWVNVNGTTRVNQRMNSSIVFHQALSDGTDKRISPLQIYSILESNKNHTRNITCFNLLFIINKIWGIIFTLIYIKWWQWCWWQSYVGHFKMLKVRRCWRWNIFDGIFSNADISRYN